MDKNLERSMDRLVELVEFLLAIELYRNTDLKQDVVAKRLGIGKIRFNGMLKGIKK